MPDDAGDRTATGGEGVDTLRGAHDEKQGDNPAQGQIVNNRGALARLMWGSFMGN